MSFQVTIKPSNHQYQAAEQKPCWNPALREGFALPYGCRNGACGSCKGKILEGQVDYGKYQDNALSAKAKNRPAWPCSAPPSRCPMW